MSDVADDARVLSFRDHELVVRMDAGSADLEVDDVFAERKLRDDDPEGSFDRAFEVAPRQLSREPKVRRNVVCHHHTGEAHGCRKASHPDPVV